MKLKITYLFVLLFFGVCKINAANYKTEVPQAVLDAFKAKYPLVKDIEWEKEGDNYEAEFEVDDKEYEALFTNDGEWVQTTTEVGLKDIPAVVLDSMKMKFPGAKIKETELVETVLGTFYEFEYKMNRKHEYALFDWRGNYWDRNETEE